MNDSDYKFLKKLTSRFQKMLVSGDAIFFDQDELIDIIDFYLHESEMDNAEKAICYAIAFYPDQPFFKLQRVKKLILEFEFDKAKKELDDLENQHEISAEFYIEKIFLNRILSPEADISELLDRAYELDPQNPDVHFFFTSEEIKNGNIDKALQHISIIFNEGYEIEEQLLSFLVLFEERQMLEEAYRFYKTITEQYPLMKTGWFAFGLANSWMERHYDAIDCYQLAISLDEEMSSAYFNMANSYYELKQYDKALTYYQTVYDNDNMDDSAITGIADCYTMTSQYDKAKEYYRNALDIYPGSPDAIRGMVSILEQFGQQDEIPAFAESLFKIAPQSFDILFEMLEYYPGEQKLEKLECLFELIYAQVDEKSMFFRFFTFHCCRNKLYDYAISILQHYYYEEEIADDVNYYFAAFYYLKGNYVKGEEYLSIALSRCYERYEEFLVMDPALSENITILSLIELYKP